MFACLLRRPAGFGILLLMSLVVFLNGCKTAPKNQESQASGSRDAEEYRKLLDALRTAQLQDGSKKESASAPSPADSEVKWARPAETPASGPPAPSATAAAAAAPAGKETQAPSAVPTVIDRPVATNPSPVQTIETMPADQQQLIRELAQVLRAAPAEEGLRSYIHRAALSLFDPRLSLKAEELTDLEPAQRQVVLSYQRIFTQLGQRLGETRAADRDQLLIAAGELNDQMKLGQMGHLSIRTVKLCRSVRGFGQYEPMGTEFAHGVVHRVILYTEVENYKSVKNDSGWYVVRLTQQVQLFKINDPAEPVWSTRVQQVVDKSRSKRSDFITVQSIPIPASLGIGRYNLKVSVIDQGGRFVDEAIVPIRILSENLASERK
ncbi:MAG: hypothetical protein R3236_00965 [Phycisphaeraceae bacterium]|nr:hypothetical protein [Phycisphaeraceae bacterium]